MDKHNDIEYLLFNMINSYNDIVKAISALAQPADADIQLLVKLVEIQEKINNIEVNYGYSK